MPFGQLGLRAKINHPSLNQLLQRITVRYHREPLSWDETREYIIHRLRKGDAQNNGLYSAETLECIFFRSGAVPRAINNMLCDDVLVYGCVD